jgi:solute carrier family 35 protein
MVFAGLSTAQRASVFRALGISAAFGVVSILTSFSFKAIFSVFRFDATFTLLAMQMAMTLAFTALLRARCQGVPGLEVPRALDPAALQASLVPGLLFVGNIAVGFYGIKLVSIPMFLTVRRTTTLFTLVAEYFVLGAVASRSVAAGVLLTVLGALVAGSDSLRTDWLGFAFVVGNNVMTAASWSATKRFSDRFRLTRFGLTYYNACVALPLCLALAAAGGEFQYVARHPQLANPQMHVALFGASALGVLMNWVTFLAVTQTSPLATSITGNVKARHLAARAPRVCFPNQRPPRAASPRLASPRLSAGHFRDVPRRRHFPRLHADLPARGGHRHFLRRLRRLLPRQAKGGARRPRRRGRGRGRWGRSGGCSGRGELERRRRRRWWQRKRGGRHRGRWRGREGPFRCGERDGNRGRRVGLLRVRLRLVGVGRRAWQRRRRRWRRRQWQWRRRLRRGGDRGAARVRRSGRGGRVGTSHVAAAGAPPQRDARHRGRLRG